ncbi:MAG: biotin--[acetyl-CoA-carboxylase] ligase [Cyanobacteria bacterium P01_D01_bin.73]
MSELQARFVNAFARLQEALPDPVDLPTLHIFDTVESTNQVLWNLAEEGAKPGTVAIALQQEAGRGQWGRKWKSPAGGLYLSWYIEPKLPVENAAQLTLCATWGVARILRDCGLPVKIKWLNDLVVGERKLGGILTETRLKGNKINRAVIGIGINWDNPVPETGTNIKTVIGEENSQSNNDSQGNDIGTLEELAALVWWGLERARQQWRSEGVTSFLADYLELLSHLYCPVSMGDRCGVVVGVNAKGELRVKLMEGENPEISAQAPGEEVALPPGSISLGYAWSSDRPIKI